MIRRAILRVAGPAGAGKTTLIEALLPRLDEDVTCVRAVLDETLRRPKELRPRKHPEMQRYRRAGAGTVALYRLPSSHADGDAFYSTDFMDEYSTVVIIEGDDPLELEDLAIFVAPPLEGRAGLLRRVRRNTAKEHDEWLDALERALESPDSLTRFLHREIGGNLSTLAAMSPDLEEKIHAKLLAEMPKFRAAPPPPPTEHWAIAPGYEGIETAQLVFVNARDAGQRDRGEALLGDLARLRSDGELFRDVIGIRGNKVPITAVVGDLRDPKDPGLQKAVRRIRRAVQAAL